MKLMILLILALAAVSASPIPPHIARLPVADVLVSFESTQPVLASINAAKHASREAKLNALHAALLQHTSAAQAQAQSLLTAQGVSFESFWINNVLRVPAAEQALLQQLAALPGVRAIRLNGLVPLAPISVAQTPRAGVLAEWGVENIQANIVWTYPGGSDGAGVRICTIDTGARGSHEALAPNFLGEYGWFDPDQKTLAPNDGNGHGTHTTGTIAGRNGIGVAPGAKWQACKGCATSSCFNADLLACGQWVTCPTLTDGVSAPNCALAPHVVSNSWAGGSGDPWYDDVIRAWHAASIIPVFANGNLGSACNTAQSPADSQARVIAVGATTNANGLAAFSSRGPSAFGSLKPGVSAPGQDVVSAFNSADNAYAAMSGTSMACPHVAGVVALLKGIRPNLTFVEVEALLFAEADHNLTPTNQDCGGLADSEYPNHSFGYGKVNAFRSIRALIHAH